MSTPAALKLLTLLNVDAARPDQTSFLTYTASDDSLKPLAEATKKAGEPTKKEKRKLVWKEDLEEGPSGSGQPVVNSSKKVKLAPVVAVANGNGQGKKGGKKGKQVELEEDSSDDEATESGPTNSMSTDAFHTHFGPSPSILSPSTTFSAQNGKWTTSRSQRPGLGRVVSQVPDASPSTSESDDVKVKLVDTVYAQFRKLPSFKTTGKGEMTDLQASVHEVLGQYKDMYLSKLDISKREEVRDVVLMHAVNHVLKTRRRILKMNEKLAHAAAASSSTADIDARDQGFTRPKILLLTPFRSTALATLNTLLSLFPAGTQIENKQRFLSEFSLPDGTEDRLLARASDWPQDHVETFQGNVDDNFRVGVKVTRKSVKLFGGFYGCDIVVGSPLGLRMSIEKEKSADFLSSVEVVVADQLDVMSMQNWEHVQFIFSKLNVLPSDAHGCDFSRVKPWYLDGQAQFLRQTVLLSSYETPEMRSLFNKTLVNVQGKVRTEGGYDGELNKVRRGVRQTFTRFESSSPLAEPDVRFTQFTEKIMPTVLKSAVMKERTMVVVPSYFDFVRVQAWFRKQGNISFASISEYSSSQEISRARTSFFKGTKNFLLITERFHFYRRYRLRGARTYLFYALPDHALFYPELIAAAFLRRTEGQLADAADDEVVEVEDVQVKALFSKWDWMKLERIVGTANGKRMLDVQAGESNFSFV